MSLLGSLKDTIFYNPDTGLFVNLVDRNSRSRKGDVLGYTQSNGYVYLRFNSKLYRAHRLAWFYVTGEWPDLEIDHIDGNRTNNKFSNLRRATTKENARNTKYRGGVSGYKGVQPSLKKWVARIKVDGKQINLGTFDDKIEAAKAYDKAAVKYFGSFAKINFKE